MVGRNSRVVSSDNSHRVFSVAVNRAAAATARHRADTAAVEVEVVLSASWHLESSAEVANLTVNREVELHTRDKAAQDTQAAGTAVRAQVSVALLVVCSVGITNRSRIRTSDTRIPAKAVRTMHKHLRHRTSRRTKARHLQPGSHTVSNMAAALRRMALQVKDNTRILPMEHRMINIRTRHTLGNKDRRMTSTGTTLRLLASTTIRRRPTVKIKALRRTTTANHHPNRASTTLHLRHNSTAVHQHHMGSHNMDNHNMVSRSMVMTSTGHLRPDPDSTVRLQRTSTVNSLNNLVDTEVKVNTARLHPSRADTVGRAAIPDSSSIKRIRALSNSSTTRVEVIQASNSMALDHTVERRLSLAGSKYSISGRAGVYDRRHGFEAWMENGSDY